MIVGAGGGMWKAGPKAQGGQFVLKRQMFLM